MNLDPVFGLPCPDESDVTALALYMQRLAETVEANLLAQRTSIRKAYRPPCAVWRNTTAFGPVPTSGLANMFWNTTDCVFANYTINGQLPALGSFVIGPFVEPGLWTVGYAVRTSEVGAVSASTLRLLTGVVYKTTADSQVVVAHLDRYLISSANANEWSSVAAVVDIGADWQNYAFAGSFTHANAASNMQIAANDAFAWAYKITADDQIEVT